MSERSARIAEWAAEAFGNTVTPLRMAARANEEMAELLKEIAADGPKSLEECADVAICLCVLASKLGGDLDTEISRKMAINRARTWKVDASGCGYHTKDTPS